MPILKREIDIFPSDLLERDYTTPSDLLWWSLYTLSRREKELMRRLHSEQICFFGPIIEKRSRSPQGRIRVSFIPLFPNYVFMYGTEQQRYEAMKSNCISRYSQIAEGAELVADLRQIHAAIHCGLPLTPEARLIPGQSVRVRSGPFRGYEGQVIRREGKTRLLLSVRYLEQGVSMEMDEGLLEPM